MKTIAVYCGSSKGIDPIYMEEAEKNKRVLIYINGNKTSLILK